MKSTPEGLQSSVILRELVQVPTNVCKWSLRDSSDLPQKNKDLSLMPTTTQHNTTATTNSSAVVLCAFILGLGRRNWKDPWSSPASEPQAKDPVPTNKWMTSEENDT